MGETPHAYVVLRSRQIPTEEELIQFTREKLAHFKAITGVTYVEELPKNASGKILKVQLRNQYWESVGKAEKFVN